MSTSNPALREDTFRVRDVASSGVMTLGGTAAKTLFLLLLVVAAAAYTWVHTMAGISAVEVVEKVGQIKNIASAPPVVWGYLTVGTLGGFVVAMFVIFSPPLAPYLTWAYALLEGLCLGSLSALFEFMYPGIALQAIGLTFGIFAAMLFIYSTGMLRASENFTKGLLAAMLGILLLYIGDILVNVFFGANLPLVHETGWAGIILSVVIRIVAALNFVLDFDTIESGVRYGAPKYMEWYGAFGLLVTLIWLYLEVIRLLAKARGNK